MSRPHSHLFEVEAEVDDPAPDLTFVMPVWTPGSYLVREFARHLEGFAAEDEAGRLLPSRRLDKHRFRVEGAGSGPVRVRYRVYAYDLTVRTAHLDGRHGYFNGANLFVFAEGRLSEPVDLEVVPPPGWRVTTALEGGPTRFRARDYDELADSPVEAGTHEVEAFEARGRRHEVAIVGRGNLDVLQFLSDLRRVVEKMGETMGEVPYDRYLFIVHLADRRRGGLEHERSTTLHLGRNSFFPKEVYEETIALAAHEFLHLWNVKRLRPAAFVPYDYSKEQYTRLLWWFEGVTSYYDRLTIVRAGVGDPGRYLKHLGQEWTALLRQPGRRKMSLEEASLTAWVKYYRPDENTPNSAVSYYQKGELVALALDLALRREGRSLDDLLRLLYRRYRSEGMPEDGPELGLAELIGEAPARRLFDRLVRGTEPLEADLDLVGLGLKTRTAQDLDDKGGTPTRRNATDPEPGWLGAEVVGGAKLVVKSVREDGPASPAGLYAEDEIVAESGFRVDRAALFERMRALGPGGELRLTVFRRDELVEVRVPLGAPPEDTVWIEPVPAPTRSQEAAFGSWAGVTLPPR